jgi:hypothetical protein
MTTESQNKSKRGGVRIGAGRKPGTPNRPNNDHLFEPCSKALTAAMDGATPFEFICAMQMLGAPLDAPRAALGMTRDAFSEKYGEAIVAFSARLKRAARLA